MRRRKVHWTLMWDTYTCRFIARCNRYVGDTRYLTRRKSRVTCRACLKRKGKR